MHSVTGWPILFVGRTGQAKVGQNTVPSQQTIQKNILNTQLQISLLLIRLQEQSTSNAHRTTTKVEWKQA